MSEGEFKKLIRELNEDIENKQNDLGKEGKCAVTAFREMCEGFFDVARKDMPKRYVYTDYTHDFGIDQNSKEFDAIKDSDYPKYIHIPNDEEWSTWAKKWFGSKKE